jgi:hypothetical protein
MKQEKILMGQKQLQRWHLMKMAEVGKITLREVSERIGVSYRQAKRIGRAIRERGIKGLALLLFFNVKLHLNQRPILFLAETLRIYLAAPEQRFLFTFLQRPGVPPTNNHAEQSLRHPVIFRKISFGTRSESGLKTHSILPSLVQTARRQGIHPREFLQTLLTADTATAQAALYNNSS